MKLVLAKLFNYWSAMDDKDRSAVQIGGSIAIVLLVVGLVIVPALKSYNHLQTRLPLLQKQLDTMRGQALEVKRLQSNPSLQKIHESILSLLESSTSLHGIKSQVQSLTPQANQTAAIRFKNVDYALLIKWMAGLRSQYHLRVSEAEFTKPTSTDSPGYVDAYLVFPDPNS